MVKNYAAGFYYLKGLRGFGGERPSSWSQASQKTISAEAPHGLESQVSTPSKICLSLLFSG